MLKRFVEADCKRRGLAIIIAGSTALVILLFFSLTFMGARGTVLWFDWNIHLLCTDEIGLTVCREWLVDFSVKYLFVLSFLVIALGIADRFGLFTRDRASGSQNEPTSHGS